MATARVAQQSPQPREDFRIRLMSDPAGLVEMAAQPFAMVSVHLGAPSRMLCRHGSESHLGTAIHGDVEIIPWGMQGSWELKERDAALVMTLSRTLMNAAARESGADSLQPELRSRFHVRDQHIEHIAWTLKTEVDQGFPNCRLFRESLGMALAVHLLQKHSSVAKPVELAAGKMSPGKLKQLLTFIEEHLSQDVTLAEIAQAAGVSVSHCNALFRQSVGSSIHQYVIRRRVERAAWLLRETRLPISMVALETGFAHQSHLAMHMRRLMGASPRKLRAQMH